MESDINLQIQPLYIDNIRALLSKASLVQAVQYFACDKVELIGNPTGYRLGQVLKTHIVMSLLSCSTLRIVIKVHFNLSQVKQYCQAQGYADIAMTDRKIIDFMKEFCNQLGGRVSRIFDANQIYMGMSVPLCSRGIYEIYTDYSPNSGSMAKFGDLWGLEGPFEIFYCSCYVEPMSQECLSGVKYIDEQSDEGEIDFL